MVENSTGNKKFVSSANFAYVQEKSWIFSTLKNNVHYQDFVCGWGAAFINITLTYPINKVIFRQMLFGYRLFPAIKELYNEGFYYLYRGILPPLIQKSISLSLMFGVYENTRRPLVEHGMNQSLACVVSGIIAGTTEAILMPFERVQTLLSDNNYHNQLKNMSHAFSVILKEHGFLELYRGLVPILLRNGPSNALFFVLREYSMKYSPLSAVIGTRSSDFANGALIGVFVSGIFYPINVVKVGAQSTLGGEFRSVRSILWDVYIDRGRRVKNIYRGVTTNCTRSFFSWGIINTSYQYLKDQFEPVVNK